MLESMSPKVKQGLAIGIAAVAVLAVAAVAMRPSDTGPDPAEMTKVGGPSAARYEAIPRVPGPSAERSVEDVLKSLQAPPDRRGEGRHRRDPTERAAKRVDQRDEAWAQTEEKLVAYATDAQWDEATTQQVHDILARTSSKVGDELAQVGTGDGDWTAARAALREARDQQFEELRTLLGDDEFDAFVTGMDFARYNDRSRGRRHGAGGRGRPAGEAGGEGEAQPLAIPVSPVGE